MSDQDPHVKVYSRKCLHWVFKIIITNHEVAADVTYCSQILFLTKRNKKLLQIQVFWFAQGKREGFYAQ